MKCVYSHDNPFLVFNIRNILENNGIDCLVKNDIISSAAGEVPPISVWPEVWIINDNDLKKSEKLIDNAIHGDPTLTSWFCLKCGETNAPAFELCWYCGNDRKD